MAEKSPSTIPCQESAGKLQADLAIAAHIRRDSTDRGSFARTGGERAAGRDGFSAGEVCCPNSRGCGVRQARHSVW
ncbi:MAG TPA: hypothetical protein PKM43_09095, partial [Verrucomicrobiota bacterium]|nr:hypothetical protein [Verrucomicrobiota bacterium]